ncbi:MAG: TetR/AcrR family transcriptional regulator [Flavobacteriaceae bacterium]|nr:TetR/AcrR family transcriptional regulator [Flavobacteriaceae bacterium]
MRDFDNFQKANQLFMENGFIDVTMDDICSELKISKKTLYQHFCSKKELIKWVLEMRNKQLIDVWENCCILEPTMTEAMLDMRQYTIKLIDLKGQRGNLAELKRYDPQLEAFYLDDLQRELVKLMTLVTKEGQDRGVFLKTLNPERLAKALTLNFFHFRLLGLQTVNESDAISKTTMYIFIRGALTDKGREEIGELLDFLLVY